MSRRRMLLVMWEGAGAVSAELGLARRLVAAGNAVAVLGDPPFEDEARAAGCDFTPWTTAPHVTSRRPEDALIRDWEGGNPLSVFKAYLREFLADPVPRWAADTDAAIVQHGPDGVLVDWALPGAMIPVEQRGLPLFSLMPNIWTLPTKGIPPFGMGFTPASNPVTKVRESAMRSIMTRMFNQALPPINAERGERGLEPVASTGAQMRRGRTLVMTSPVFDFTSPHQPDTAVYIGPMLDDPSWAEAWSSPWAADDDRPLVLVGMSSGFQDQAAALNRVADALAGLPVRALITTGAVLDPALVPSRSGAGDVVVTPHAPHSQVLPETAILLTHCGHGTTMKGLVAGVPMVCMPMGRDQGDNAARVVHHGAGVRITQKADVAAIRRAVVEVRDNPRYREGAAALGRRIAAGEGCTDPVAPVEAGIDAASA